MDKKKGQKFKVKYIIEFEGVSTYAPEDEMTFQEKMIDDVITIIEPTITEHFTRTTVNIQRIKEK